MPALLKVLGYTADEFVSVGHDGNGTFRTAVYRYGNAPIVDLPDNANIYFGINPALGPARVNCGRGQATDVTRLSALWADLDSDDGKCGDIATAEAIIDDLSAVLGTRPSAITASGGGLHPYWPIEDGQIGDAFTTSDANTILRCWKYLVRVVASKHGAKADTVFDLPRMLRAPGSFNCKAATNGHRVLVRTLADTGDPLRLSEIAARLPEVGDGAYNDGADDDGEQVSHPSSWEPAESTCSYARAYPTGFPPMNQPVGVIGGSGIRQCGLRAPSDTGV